MFHYYIINLLLRAIFIFYFPFYDINFYYSDFRLLYYYSNTFYFSY